MPAIRAWLSAFILTSASSVKSCVPHLTHLVHSGAPCLFRPIIEQAVVLSKRLRNKISGFTTHLMKRISAAPSAASPSSSRRRSASARTTTSPRSLPTKVLLESLNFDSIQVNVITPVLAVPERDERRERRIVSGAGRS
ncbi:40S ribosomal protein S17 [Pholiota molesta]|nr:40S ribosomal protein S17 [Pholiota molesta]KAF8175399.1 40S ribosomal protein S17 [Pholiota molesta]